MRYLVLLARTMLASICATMFIAFPAQAAPKSWQVTESSGDVMILAGETSVAAERGAVLKAGDAVETGATGRAVIVRGGEYVIVSPKSRVRIADPAQDDKKTQIVQSLGSALFKIEKKESWDFGVKTPYLAAVVKGTTFNVTVTSAGATVQVTEGKVEVSTLDGGAADLIVPGRIARVDAGDAQLLVVLGADEKSIRSPLPAPNAAEPAQQADDAASTASNTSAAGGSVIDLGAASGFSGSIVSPISENAVSVAAVTGGLVGGGQTIESLLIGLPVPAAAINGGSNGNGNAGNGSNDGGDTAGGVDVGIVTGVGGNGGSNGNGNGNSGGIVDVGVVAGVGGNGGAGSGNSDGGVDIGLVAGVGGSGGNGDSGGLVDVGAGVSVGGSGGTGGTGGLLDLGVDAGVGGSGSGGLLDLGVDLGVGLGGTGNSDGQGNSGGLLDVGIGLDLGGGTGSGGSGGTGGSGGGIGLGLGGPGGLLGLGPN